MPQYRIVTDEYLGFEAQIRRWWWPFWAQVNACNTHSTIERAENYCRMHANRGHPLKYLGHWSARKDEPEVAAVKKRALHLSE